MSAPCPLCGSEATQRRELIRTAEIAWLYRRAFQLAVQTEFGKTLFVELRDCPVCALAFFWPAHAGSEAFYERLQNFDFYYQKEKPEFDFARRLITAGAFVLEVGSGTGAFAQTLPEATYTGLELSARAVQAGRAAGLDMWHESVEQHAQKAPGRYDVVCAFQVLEHVANPRSFLEACRRCVKPGGVLIFSVPNAESFVAVGVNNILNLPPHHLTWWSERCFRWIANHYALEIESVACEPLASVHVHWYVQTVVMHALRKSLGWPMRVVDVSWPYRFLARAALPATRWLRLAFEDSRLSPAGHSLNIVFRRPRASR